PFLHEFPPATELGTEQTRRVKSRSKGAQSQQKEKMYRIDAHKVLSAIDDSNRGVVAGKIRTSDYGQSTDETRHELTDSTGDLAEAEAEIRGPQHEHDGLQRLRKMLATTRAAPRTDSGGTPESILRVLRLYDTLDDGSKQDVRLKGELLTWLSAQHDAEADIRCGLLYSSILLEHRSLLIYQAAIASFLRRGLHIHAVKLHKEALKHIRNADQVTKTFFDYAVTESKWQLAMNVFSQYRLHNAQGSRGVELFWLHVSELPRLLVKALSLAKYYHAMDRAGTANHAVRSFTCRFYAEALLQEFEDERHPDPAFNPRNLPKGAIGRLFAHVQALDQGAPEIHNRLLIALLRPHRKGPYVYPQIHRIVSYIYLALRDSETKIHEKTFDLLLKRLTQYWDDLQRQSEIHHSITVPTVLKDWQGHYGVLSRDAVSHVLSWYASRGRVDHFDRWLEYYKEHYSSYEEYKAVLHSTVYLHARRADLPAARLAFDAAVQAAAQHKETPPLLCWNVLVHAHARVDDLEGGLETLQNLISSGCRPDHYSFHPVLQMLAQRGDVEGVQDLLVQYDGITEEKREAHFVGSLLLAHTNSGDVEEGERVLQESIKAAKTGSIRGSLTGSFNALLTAYALRRDVDATMRIYHWMRDEGIRKDANTYAALIQALALHRQTPAATKILKSVMPKERIMPTAFHYAIVMTGFVNQGMVDHALRMHKDMRTRNIRPTFTSKLIYLKAKAIKEHQMKGGKEAVTPLSDTMAELKIMLANSLDNDVAAHQPGLALGSRQDNNGTPAAYFAFLIYVHGRRRCFEAVKELLNQYQTRTNTDGQHNVPIHLLTALMSAHLVAGEYSEVEGCWQLAKESANQLAKTIPVPQLQALELEQDKDISSQAVLGVLDPNASDAQEAGFRTSDTNNAVVVDQAIHTTTSVPEQSLLAAMTSEAPTSRPSPGRRHVLARPLRYYLTALHRQNRTADSVSTVTKLIRQGYTLDNHTWNGFLTQLCQSDPPLVLLAFTLMERLLIPHFPGWAAMPPGGAHAPNPSSRAEGLEYTKARYLAPGQLMPKYRTMVHLGSALLQLRRIEAVGRRGPLDRSMFRGLEKYIGTLKAVRKQAPRTLFAVQTMPTIDDALQTRLLGRRG
ncbi:hypothetical protein LTR78_008532, partial [Recurvomyces mirabilis]